MEEYQSLSDWIAQQNKNGNYMPERIITLKDALEIDKTVLENQLGLGLELVVKKLQLKKVTA